MATTNTPTTLASRLKEVYPDGITNIIPQSTYLEKHLKFKEEMAPGEQARFDVQLSHESGFTVGAAGDLTLNAPVAQESAKALVDGYQIVLRSRVSYDLIKKAKNDKKAFAKFNDSKFIPMTESFAKRCEVLAMGYGRQSLGKVDANNSGVLTITPGTWCSNFWLGAKGTVLEAFTSGGSQHDGDLVVSAVSVANKTVTVTGTSSAVVQNDLLYFKGHRAASPYGLIDIATASSTIYNINPATYELWKGNAYDVGTSACTMGKILEAAALAADKGCDETLTCLVPNKLFQVLVLDQSFLRQYNGSYNKKAENGFEELVFHGGTGEIKIIPYIFIKEGEFVMFPERMTYKIGCSNTTNSIEEKTGDVIFDLPDNTSKEMRMYANWTVFCERPGWMVIGTRSDGLALHT